MKKFWMTLAAISLCTCAICACSDDDKDKDINGNGNGNSAPEKLADGEQCSKSAECSSDFCSNNKKVCAPKPAGDKANDVACDDHEECQSGYCNISDANAHKCAELPTGTYNCASFEKGCGKNDIAYVSCDPKHGIVEVDCKLNNDGKTQCYGGDCVNPNAEEYECSNDTHCADKADKPFCVEHTCVAQKVEEQEDPCKDVTCPAGSCYLHICVTTEMQNLRDGEYCKTNTFQTFCDGNELVECANNHIIRTNCPHDNIGKCTVIENFGDYIAACSGNDKAKELCEDNESSDPPAETIKVCYGDQDWGTSAMCVVDIMGEMVAYPFSDGSDNYFNLSCEGKRCVYDTDDTPICGTEDAVN